MKLKSMILASLAAGALLFSACGGSASSSSSSTAPSSAAPSSVPASSAVDSSMAPALEDMVYRGRIDSIEEDGSITVSQLDGFDYGNATIVFHVAPETEMIPADAELAEGNFVEIWYSGMLTFSLPPQGTATSIEVISPMSEGIIVNGTVQEVVKTDDLLTIQVLPLEAGDVSATMDNVVVLQVPLDALENLAEADLEPGAKVSAVTSGIATSSIPPQMPVLVLLPYQPAAAESAV